MNRPADERAEETVRLRTAPPRVARLSRPVILVTSGVAVVAIAVALAVALHGRTPKPVEIPIEEPDAKPPLAAMADAPKTYGDVPRLGPPLPGDLGRPILAAQAKGVDAAPPAMGPGAGSSSSSTEGAQRSVADSARTASLFTGQAPRSAPGANASAPALTMPSISLPAPLLASPSPQAQPSDPRQAFLDRRAGSTASGFRLEPPTGRRILQAHTVIPAALQTAVSSDLPGPVAAQVTRNVYDSLTGREVLIPQGSKLLGTYEARVAFGQRRVLLAWDRLLLPDGRSLQLDRLVAGDAAGRAGLSDRIDAHWGETTKAALLSTLLGVGAELGSDSEGEVTQAIREGLQGSINQTGEQLVRRQLDVQPTLSLRAGLPLSILVTRDIVFDTPVAAAR